MRGGLSSIWLLALTLGLLACDEGAEAPLVGAEIWTIIEGSNQVVFGLKHYITSEGIRRAHLEADTAFFLEDGGAVELRVLHVDFYGHDGALTSILTSKQGIYDWNSGDMTARDSVVVLNPVDERRVETSVMHYDRVRNRIWSDQPTTMYEADGTIIDGTAFDSDASLSEVNLISARMRKPGSGQPKQER